MAQYESLKDYLNLNKKDEIIRQANDYLQAKESDYILKDITILTAGCVELFPLSASVMIDVIAESYDDISKEISNKYYSMIIFGTVDAGFADMTVSIVEEISEAELQEEDVCSLFGLPDVSEDNLEEKAEWLYKGLYARIPHDPKHKYWFDPVKVKEKYKASDNMHMWPADLPDDCLGRIYLKPSIASIYDIEDMSRPYPDEPIPANSILINSKYYKNQINRYDDIIIAAHELVHWSLHKLYFNICQLLEEDYECMKCSSEPIVLDDSMSTKEKAYWYAEWQANELAIRVAMPKHLVERAIEEYNNDVNVHDPADVPFSGKYYQDMIYKLSSDFNVPEEIMKMRLLQLGHDYADGTFINIDEQLYKPFTFPQGTLKENETFVIDRSNYERLLRENEEFAELIDNKICVYTGYVVCINSPKYINYSIYNKQINYSLSDYACRHADECCLIFTLYTTSDTNNKTPLIWNFYLCSDIINETKELRYYNQKSQSVTESMNRDIEKMIQDKKMYDKMVAKGITTFSKALVYIMDNEGDSDKKTDKMVNIKKDDLAEFLGCDAKTIQNYRNGHSIPTSIEKVMLICLVCETGPKVSQLLIEKSIGGIPDIDMKKIAYEELLRHTDAPLSVWDEFLQKIGLPPIRF